MKEVKAGSSQVLRAKMSTMVNQFPRKRENTNLPEAWRMDNQCITSKGR